ncbi:ring-infected erythrocyte surface antigen domain-containing protein [Aliarcobacter cryaerophilus]|uniref:Uncharacterized protein n=2 Tax=unclassified Arcobacter TaxID=2593671 RepID=A0AA96DBY4_9BACT|nr:hypothetical protein RJG51_05590 [Arcobacter sp. AZ-2023]WNL18472.1 hypothetical protein RJG53_07680 [Arcobacter sp. AZ-2023]WNL20607.1 hypothetical protein RJG56_07530 [Arcobacter sp. AZ-2023]WNL25886.1 hypothetical protein RJG57_01535 [Arcobacter sp. AZ-2023]WPD10816.1 hypothetical protein QUR77_05550 [Arcobacter sp. DSM 115954]
MNIFIYGNQNFKNEVHKILLNSKIETILEDVKIEDISNIDILKDNIAKNPDDIYLIDEDKIIKKSRFKFLKQKDGIEEDFLLQYGVNDLSIDSLEEIPNYIIRKYERIAFKEKDKSEEIKNEDLLLDNELANLLESKEQENSQNLTSSILEEPVGININELDNLIELESSDKEKLDTNYISMEDFDENFGLNNVSFDYDDDSTFNQDLKSDEDLLQDILNNSIVDEDDYEFVGETFEDVNFLDEIFPNSTIFDMDENSTKSINIVLQEKDKEETNEDELKKDELENIENFQFNEVFQNIENKKDEDIKQIDKNIDIIENIEEKNEEEKTPEYENIEIDELNDLNLEDFSFADLDLQNKKSEDVSKKGEDMSDDFFELDSLNEQDLIEALSGSGISNVAQTDTQSIQEPQKMEISNNNIDIGSSNINDIASLISKLLNNKTLEITIKIKE